MTSLHKLASEAANDQPDDGSKCLSSVDHEFSYRMLKLLGSGSFGHCFSAEKSDSPTNVAWKRNIKVSRVLGREYEVLLALKDESNCLQLTDYFLS